MRKSIPEAAAMNGRCRTPTRTHLTPLTHLPNPSPNYSLVCSISFPFLSSSSYGVTILSKSNCLRRHRCIPKAGLFSDLPLLSFEPDEVLVPSETKTLHLYEARFLALLEESIVSKKKLFVHFAIEPVLSGGSSLGASFTANYGCLVLIENVKRLEIGALVSIRGIGRVSIVKLVQIKDIDEQELQLASAYFLFLTCNPCNPPSATMDFRIAGLPWSECVIFEILENGQHSAGKRIQTDSLEEPYLRGLVLPLQDNVPDIQNEINSMVVELSDAVYSLSSLQIKLKAPKDEPLQTPIINSLRWAEREPIIDCDGAFVPSLAERISFAALQPVSGMTSSELRTLQTEKLQAMKLTDTAERLASSSKLVKQNIAVVAAKLAIQSVNA